MLTTTEPLGRQLSGDLFLCTKTKVHDYQINVLNVKYKKIKERTCGYVSKIISLELFLLRKEQGNARQVSQSWQKLCFTTHKVPTAKASEMHLALSKAYINKMKISGNTDFLTASKRHGVACERSTMRSEVWW